jgi:ATP-dependent DNA helicase RecG
MDIHSLLSAPESKTLEFKENISSLLPILKTIVAFANTAGGILIIGRSSEGKIVGVHDVFKAEEALASSISDNIVPCILPEIEVVTFEGKNLLVVQVPYWKAPFYLKKEGIPHGIYISLGTTNRPTPPEILRELQRSTVTASFDQEPITELAKTDVDLEKASAFFANIGKKITEEKLHTLGVLVPSAHKFVPSIGGLILFGTKESRDKFAPDARVACSRFAGNTKTHMVDQMTIEGTIVDALEEVPKFILRNTRLSSQIKTFQRKDIPEYPTLALREALVNALAHADYSLRGSCIQISIFSDRLEIQNPGMLPLGLTLDDFKSGISRVRNRVIARVFHELGFMEEWGTGYSKIVEICKTGSYPEPIFEELGTTMRVTFFPHLETLAQETPREIYEEPFIERQATILSLLKQKALTFREIYEQFPSVSERTIRYDLAYLKRNGLLNSRGTGRATLYSLKKEHGSSAG